MMRNKEIEMTKKTRGDLITEGGIWLISVENKEIETGSQHPIWGSVSKTPNMKSKELVGNEDFVCFYG
jgi:hypothetical protein